MSQSFRTLHSKREFQGPAIDVTTSLGSFIIEFDFEAAPLAIASCLALVKGSYYDGVLIHRVVPNFGIQFGCSFTKTAGRGADWGKGGAEPNSEFATQGGKLLRRDRGGSVADEFIVPRSNVARTVSFATGPSKNSVSCQLFVNTVDNVFLDWTMEGKSVVGVLGHRQNVVGKVVEGWDVLERIEIVDVSPEHVPSTPIQIVKITVLKDMESPKLLSAEASVIQEPNT